MPGVGLIRSKLRPSRWLSPKSKQSFSKRRLLITASSKSFSARCANSVSKSSSDRHRESANAPVANIPKVPYLSAIRPSGFVRTEEVTLPGFKHDLYATGHPLFLISKAYSELGADLRARGLEYLNTDLPTGVLLPDGTSGILSGDLKTSAAEFDRLSPGDGQALADLMGEFG